MTGCWFERQTLDFLRQYDPSSVLPTGTECATALWLNRRRRIAECSAQGHETCTSLQLRAKTEARLYQCSFCSVEQDECNFILMKTDLHTIPQMQLLFLTS
jgi:hypothetical protein